jgi:hypothetical protein
VRSRYSHRRRCPRREIADGPPRQSAPAAVGPAVACANRQTNAPRCETTMQPCRTFWEEGFVGRLRLSALIASSVAAFRASLTSPLDALRAE